MRQPQLTLVHPSHSCQTWFAGGVNIFQAAKEKAAQEAAGQADAETCEDVQAMVDSIASNGYPHIRPLLLRYLATCQPPVQSVLQIQEYVNVSSPGLYHHLKGLRKAGIVSRRLGEARPAMRRPGVFYLTTREKEINQ